MRISAAMFLLLLHVVASALLCDGASVPSPTTPFDQYGAVLLEYEKARLDNFAIQLQNEENLIGYILVFDRTGGCAGEAKARSMRAKRYVVEHRGIPWNRVIWRREGYDSSINTTLLLAPRGAIVPFPYRSPAVVASDGPATRACIAKLGRIKRSRW